MSEFDNLLYILFLCNNFSYLRYFTLITQQPYDQWQAPKDPDIIKLVRVEKVYDLLTHHLTSTHYSFYPHARFPINLLGERPRRSLGESLRVRSQVRTTNPVISTVHGSTLYIRI